MKLLNGRYLLKYLIYFIRSSEGIIIYVEFCFMLFIKIYFYFDLYVKIKIS